MGGWFCYELAAFKGMSLIPALMEACNLQLDGIHRISQKYRKKTTFLDLAANIYKKHRYRPEKKSGFINT